MGTNRRRFLTAAGCSLGAASATTLAPGKLIAAEASLPTVAQPARIDRILFSCKYTMTKGENIEARFQSCKDAGFDGIDFDDCGKYTADQVRQASYNTGLFVHNAINHAHWAKRFTSGNPAAVETATKNLEHCIRVSQAAGGSGVLLVIGRNSDGPAAEVADRARANISKLLPLAAALGQQILFENVWNGMFYHHGGSPDQDCQELIAFIDSFKSPWIGAYFDIGNHHRYGNVGDWIRALGHRVVKLDLKGYDRSKALETKRDGQWRDITAGDIDWADVRKALAEINFHGWTTAEVGGGDTARLKKVRADMQRALVG